MRHFEEEEEYRPEGRGRSAKKREAKAIEQMAQELADMSETELAKLSMGDELTKEVELARNTKGHSSRKRQIKHLAGFLRKNEDEREAIAASLEGQAVSQRQETLAFHHLEELRDRLCDASSFDTALTEVRSLYPVIDDKKLARLARSVHENNDKKAAREIFRRLRKATETEDE
jgi:ribosome-associated protein